MATVDIVIPCYRYGRFLEGCVRSILSQSMDDVRVLIIDDASPDDSADVARALAASDPRVEALIHEKNRGHIATYNEGIDWAESPFFLSLSADDYLAPFALERAATIMGDEPQVVMTFGACVNYFEGEPPPDFAGATPDGNWRVWSGRDFIELHCARVRNLVPTPTAIVRTATQKAIGGYLPALPHAGDLEMWLRFAAYGAIAETQSPQAVYRIHGSNMSAGYYKTIIRDYAQRRDAFVVGGDVAPVLLVDERLDAGIGRRQG
ncbi:glycosyltransferase family 2 protein, partial [Hansschlegelia beijingensis]